MVLSFGLLWCGVISEPEGSLSIDESMTFDRLQLFVLEVIIVEVFGFFQTTTSDLTDQFNATDRSFLTVEQDKQIIHINRVFDAFHPKTTVLFPQDTDCTLKVTDQRQAY